MKKITLIIAFFISFSLVNFSANATELKVKNDNVGDTAAVRKYSNLKLNAIAYNKKFSLNVRKEAPKPYFQSYNSFDISTKKPDYIKSVLMRKGNSIQAIPIYTYTLPF